MQQYRVRSWKYGGLVVQERHATQETKLHKNQQNVGKITSWKNIKWPIKEGLMQCLVDLMIEEDKDFGNANNLDEIKVVMRRYSDVREQLVYDMIESLETKGWVEK